MTEKQYPDLPTHFMLVQESFRDEVYLYTADQMRAYVDADRAMRAAPAAPASQDALHAAKHCLEMGESFRALRRVVNLLLDARRNLGPEDHELRDRIDRLLRDDAARAAQEGDKP